MAIIAGFTITATFPLQINIGVSIEIAVGRCLDMITVAVPAALPVAMSCGIVFAVRRLKKKGIFCISPPRINIAGQINTFVFDKTGTLTEEGLTVLGFRPTAGSDDSRSATFQNFTDDAKTLTPQGTWWTKDSADNRRNQNSTLLVEAMASCTAITFVNGSLVGDPLDVQMFEATGWTLDETDGPRRVTDGLG